MRCVNMCCSVIGVIIILFQCGCGKTISESKKPALLINNAVYLPLLEISQWLNLTVDGNNVGGSFTVTSPKSREVFSASTDAGNLLIWNNTPYVQSERLARFFGINVRQDNARCHLQNTNGNELILPMQQEVIVYTSVVGNTRQVFSMKPDGSAVRQLTNTGDNLWPRLSRDGKFLYYISRRNNTVGIYKSNVKGLTEQPVVVVSDTIYAFTLSEDGNMIYYLQKGSIYCIPSANGQPQELLKNVGPYFALLHGDAELAYTEIKYAHDSGGFVYKVLDIATMKSKDLTDDIGQFPSSISSDGRIAIYEIDEGEMVDISLNVKNYVTNTTKRIGLGNSSSISPDATTIVYTFPAYKPTINELFSISIDGSNKKQLTNNGGNQPYWGVADY